MLVGILISLTFFIVASVMRSFGADYVVAIPTGFAAMLYCCIIAFVVTRVVAQTVTRELEAEFRRERTQTIINTVQRLSSKDLTAIEQALRYERLHRMNNTQPGVEHHAV